MLRMTYKYTLVIPMIIYEHATILKYLTPSAITCGSFVKILINDAGIVNAAIVNIAVTIIPNAKIFSIAVLSPFPQYCAVRTVAPDVNPNKNSTIMY